MVDSPAPITPQPIPQSSALREAAVDSLSELFSRDPEGYQRQDRDRIIAALRADRARRDEADRKAGETGKKKSSTAVKLTAPVAKSADELGL